MNGFFSQCKGLVATHVREFHLLRCIHVHWKGNIEKDFSLYCDPSFKSKVYGGDTYSVDAPRYSGVQYKVSLTDEDVYEGQVVGIISFRPLDEANSLFLLVNRFATPHLQNEYFQRSLPQRLVKYHKVGPQVTTDCIPFALVIAPVFIVPAMDYGNGFTNIGNADEVNARFYIITQDKVQCSNLLDYEAYLNRNNNEYSERKWNNTSNYMNFNAFLTVHEMLSIKDMLQVSRNSPEYSNDVVEAYEFDFDEDHLFEQEEY
jgi:hypothetical protein